MWQPVHKMQVVGSATLACSTGLPAAQRGRSSRLAQLTLSKLVSNADTFVVCAATGKLKGRQSSHAKWQRITRTLSRSLWSAVSRSGWQAIPDRTELVGRGLFAARRPVALRLLTLFALLRCSQLRRRAGTAEVQQVPHRLVLWRQVPEGAGLHCRRCLLISLPTCSVHFLLD